MELRHLKHFQAVAHQQSFGKAAKVLHLSQPALSRSIQSLEAFLNVPLFDRYKRTIVLTPFGHQVLKRINAILQGAELITQEIAEMKGTKKGEMKIGASGVAAHAFLGQAIGKFLQKHPQLNVQVKIQHWKNLAKMLRAGEIDFFIGETENLKDQEDLHTSNLASDRAVIFCRSGHPILSKTNIKMSDLRKYPMALPESLPKNIKEELDFSLIKQADLGTPFGEIIYDNFMVAKSILRHSDAISITPLLAIRNELEKGVFSVIPLIDMPSIRANFGIVRLRDRTSSPAVETFIATQVEITNNLE